MKDQVPGGEDEEWKRLGLSSRGGRGGFRNDSFDFGVLLLKVSDSGGAEG